MFEPNRSIFAIQRKITLSNGHTVYQAIRHGPICPRPPAHSEHDALQIVRSASVRFERLG
ncbi:hypothetical protein OCH239_10055 [Roseivivax halodurans JCM 10272]|uniref:Uncharacterized protein n=1 Tax=Roseivivax halodurans JCM 10272 TaxID=1449350 RepID=X7ECD8_9RHOB|nr:hypothetical protein OCH239_10055 [Roseivivax halodurans JCM 10272]